MTESLHIVPRAATRSADEPLDRGQRAPLLACSSSRLKVLFSARGGSTYRDRVFEAGALRLRLPRGPACEALIVNTGGGIVGGDRLALDVHLGAEAVVSLSTVAAEKVYRATGSTSTIETRLTLDAGARLDWMPQETILFDGAHLRRSLAIDMAADARLIAMETIVFGRLASAETTIAGRFRDSWRVRRGGHLVFADETRLDGAIGATLDRPAVGDGARAVALLLVVAPDAEASLEPLREALAPSSEVEAGASCRDGILVARLLSHSPEHLRAATIAALSVVRATPLPRSWL